MYWKLTMTGFMMTLVAPLTACGGARAEVEPPPLHGRNFTWQRPCSRALQYCIGSPNGLLLPNVPVERSTRHFPKHKLPNLAARRQLQFARGRFLIVAGHIGIAVVALPAHHRRRPRSQERQSRSRVYVGRSAPVWFFRAGKGCPIMAREIDKTQTRGNLRPTASAATRAVPTPQIRAQP